MKSGKIAKLLDIICCILPMFFWGLILFSFEEKTLAFATLISALIHELGHLAYIFSKKGISPSFKSVINGFRIATRGISSYDEEIFIYLSGPFSNLLASLICIILSIIITHDFMQIAIINLATALSNLLPIRGYDGYGAIRAFLKKNEVSGKALNILSSISSALTFSLCILSLYLIDRYSEGYWIFAVFSVSTLKELKVGLGE